MRNPNRQEDDGLVVRLEVNEPTSLELDGDYDYSDGIEIDIKTYQYWFNEYFKLRDTILKEIRYKEGDKVEDSLREVIDNTLRRYFRIDFEDYL